MYTRVCDTNITASVCDVCPAKAWLQSYGAPYYIAKVILLTVSLFLNSTILVAVSVSTRLREIHYTLIASLAGSDIVTSCSGLVHCIVVLIGTFINHWPSAKVCESLAAGITYFFFLGVYSAYGNLILISSERWVYISHPFLHQRINSQRLTVFIVVLIWFGSIIFNIDVLTTDMTFPLYLCQTVKFGVMLPVQHFSWSIILLAIYIHISVITCRQVRAIKKASFAGGDSTNGETDPRMVYLRKKWAKVSMFVYVFGTFFIFLTPNICCNIYLMFVGNVNGDILGFVRLLLCTHSCTNFFVYAFRDKDFKLVLGKLWGKCVCFPGQSKVNPVIQ